jgi:monofunctional biosynthetic peptidoglycan transglycosylase
MKRILVSSVLLTTVVSLVYYCYATLPDVSALIHSHPRTTALMELRDREYKDKGVRSARRQVWVPYSAVSDHLKKAILISEDAAFFSHRGIDVNELQAALRRDWETLSFSRGGSTITMQLARNLYLSPAKNPLRKLKEILIAHRLEYSLSKRRIFEIYLNVVELGPNLYGVEAAARAHFGKAAADVDPVEAATLAALLPNPRSSRPRNILHRRNLILERLASVGYLDQAEFRRARQTPLFSRVENKVTPVRPTH